MKKLFVLFLLVALVPFSIGCFGSDSDDTPLDIAKLSASAVLPASAGANLRAAAVAASKFKNVTMTIGEGEFKQILTAETEEDNGDGTYKVTFGKVVTSAQYNAATTGILPVTITKNDGTTVSFAVDFSTLSPSAPLAVVVTAAGGVTSSVGKVYTANEFVTVKSITGTTNTLKPTFTVVFSGDIGSIDNPKTFDVKVTSETTTAATSASDFVTSYDVSKKTMTVTLKDKSLTDGKTYTVTINKIVSSTDILVTSTSHKFTIALTK
ncbi:MAG TPA: hypothetical protein PLM07_05505 [Candidatus Rifleibacterium sp.]|nr:hypothetical protein [Candidatus Rifleibacterium sp.]HPT45338.1 hypothetical protein [Candidatus Rifleibacterium sp.]